VVVAALSSPEVMRATSLLYACYLFIVICVLLWMHKKNTIIEFRWVACGFNSGALAAGKEGVS
jgi:hypothetical protein